MVFNKTKFDILALEILKYLKYGPALLLFAVFLFGGIFIYIAKFLLVFFYSIIAWIGGKIARLKLSFGKYFQLSLHAATAVLVVQSIYYLLTSYQLVPRVDIPYVIIFLGYLIFVLRQLKKHPI